MNLTQKVSLQELQNLWRLLTQLENIQRNQKVSCYRPLRNHDEFHRCDSVPTKLALGSNRSGKSVAGVNEAIAHSLGYRPWLPEDDPNHIVRLNDGNPIAVPNIGRIVAPKFVNIEQTIYPKIREWAPFGWYTIKKNNNGIPVQLTWKNGSIIYFMSNDQDDDVFEGPNGHWVWIDEPIDYAKFTGLKRGLIDFSGHMWFTLTPLSQPWIADVLVAEANEPGGSVRLFHFDIWDNWIGNGGYLRKVEIEDFIKKLKPDELEARLHGNFKHLFGRVFKEWSPEPPFWINPFELPTTWPRVCIIDPHPRKPVAVLWIAFSPDNQKYVYRELFDNSLVTIKEVSNCIKELEGWKYNEKHEKWYTTPQTEVVAARFIDNSAQEMERTSGLTVAKKFRQEGIWCTLAKKNNAAAGYDAIHEALRTRTEWSEPEIVIFNICVTVKRNFQFFCWDDWQTSRQKDLRDEKQEVRKKDDDMIDCIRYPFQHGVTYQMLKGMERSMQEWTYAEEEREDTNRQVRGMNILRGIHIDGGRSQSTRTGQFKII